MPVGNGSKTHFRSGMHGKGNGTGAFAKISKEKIGDNMVLSNRDKAQHSDLRGMDGKSIQTEKINPDGAVSGPFRQPAGT